ncbi:MAG: hypothetical protein Q8Q12_19285 [bacterium]|nr:hypothetical protein [bacterium]
MKNVLIFVAICLIGVGVYFGFIHKPSVQRAGDEVEIIPGIKVKFTRNEDAGEYYGRMMRSFLARRTGSENRKNLTEHDRKWFMLGTS